MVVCPDQRWQAVLDEVLLRQQSLGLSRALEHEVVRIPGRTDGGTRTEGVALLQMHRRTYRHELLIFDHRGCGDPRPAQLIEADLDETLESWGKALVVDPDLEDWFVGGHTHYARLRGMDGVDAIRWWRVEGFLGAGAAKPEPRKEAVESLFRAHSVRPSSANYRKVAQRASLRLERCKSRSFRVFVETLRGWFGGP